MLTQLNTNQLFVLSNHFRFEYATYFNNQMRFKAIKDESFNGVFLYNKVVASYYNMKHPTEEPMIMSTDGFMNVYVVLYLKKNSPLVHPLNMQLHKLRTNGLIQHWRNRYRDAKYRKYQQQRIPKKFSIDHLEGIFYICGIMYFIACLVFLFEIILDAIQRRFIKFLRLVNSM